MKLADQYADEDPGLNLTPMIDVVFLLLIFFMLATTFMDPEKDINLDLPSSSEAGSVSEEIDEIIVNVLADGSTVISGQTLDEANLLARLRQAAAQDAETQVTIRGDANTTHQNIVRVMDYCTHAGLGNLAIATMDSSGS